MSYVCEYASNFLYILVLTVVSENLDIGALIEILDKIASSDSAETAQKDLKKLVVTLRTHTAWTEDSEKVRLECMLEMHALGRILVNK